LSPEKANFEIGKRGEGDLEGLADQERKNTTRRPERGGMELGKKKMKKTRPSPQSAQWKSEEFLSSLKEGSSPRAEKGAKIYPHIVGGQG